MGIHINFLTRTAMFLALSLALQIFRFPPFITGPLVNLLLAMAVFWAGPASGATIGLLTPWAALLLGILPAPLMPAIPFIMLGNLLYTIILGMLYRYIPSLCSCIFGVIIGAAAKFIVIASAVSFFLTLPASLAGALLFPQLYHALIGGLTAVFLSSYIPGSILYQSE